MKFSKTSITVGLIGLAAIIGGVATGYWPIKGGYSGGLDCGSAFFPAMQTTPRGKLPIFGCSEYVPHRGIAVGLLIAGVVLAFVAGCIALVHAQQQD